MSFGDRADRRGQHARIAQQAQVAVDSGTDHSAALADAVRRIDAMQIGMGISRRGRFDADA